MAKWCEEGTPGLQLAIGRLLGSLAQDPDNQAIIQQQGLSPVILAMGTPGEWVCPSIGVVSVDTYKCGLMYVWIDVTGLMLDAQAQTTIVSHCAVLQIAPSI